LLPKTYIPACTKDPTHQECLFFYEECKKQGVDAQVVEWVGWPHFFWILPESLLPKSKEFLDVWCEKLRGMVA
jgi:acetyl esterase/lipase